MRLPSGDAGVKSEIMAKKANKAKKGKKGGKTRKRNTGLYAAMIVVAVVAMVFAVRYLRTGEPVKVTERFFQGAADAAIVLEEFGDFG